MGSLLETRNPCNLMVVDMCFVCVCVPCVMLRLGILGVGLFAGEVFLRLLAGPGVEHKKDTVQEPWGFSHPAFNKESF